jgi:hypothetical protein
MRGGNLRYLIIVIALFFYTFTYPQIAKSESSEFVLTFNCGNEKNIKLCLIGKYPPSKPINLLSQINSSICKAKTLKTFDYAEYPHNIPNQALQVTPVELKKCLHPEQYTLAFLKKNAFEYELTSMAQKATGSSVDMIDKIIRKSKILSESEDLFQDYLSIKPVLYIPVPTYREIYIAQYLVNPYPRPGVKYGPLFFYGNKEVTRIDSEATITKTFKLNGRHFVMFDHGCWEGCGNNYTTLLEIQGNKLKTIFEDGTWAD